MLYKVHHIEELELKLPLWEYFKLFKDNEYSCLLESTKQDPLLGRYSIIGSEPFFTLKATRDPSVPKRAHIEIKHLLNKAGERLLYPDIVTLEANPLQVIEDIFLEYKIHYTDSERFDLPFIAGAIGYFGYEAVNFIEDLPLEALSSLNIPDIYLVFFNSLFISDHLTKKNYLAVTGIGETQKIAEFNKQSLLKKGLDNLAKIDSLITEKKCESENMIQQGVFQKKHDSKIKNEYYNAIERVKKLIHRGDIYQLCLTRKIEEFLPTKYAWDLYKILRIMNPAPFSAYINFPEVKVVCSSPERFLKIDPDCNVESRPIKGTRKKVDDRKMDLLQYEELKLSAKEKAENVMIVDLVRNDLSRVCEVGTVRVSELTKIEEYATVWQMVSTVTGKLEADKTFIDLIEATFPGGSMTGAPKIRAMQIINSIETSARGIYSGAIGYMDFSGSIDLAMVIRSFILYQDSCYLHVGGGITIDSCIEDEFQETIDKAEVLLKSLHVLKDKML